MISSKFEKRARKILRDGSLFKKVDVTKVRWQIETLELYSLSSVKSPFIKPVMVALNKERSFLSADGSSFASLVNYVYKESEKENVPVPINTFLQIFTFFFSRSKVMLIKADLVHIFNKASKTPKPKISKPIIVRKEKEDIYKFWIYRFAPILIEFKVQKTGEFTYKSSSPINFLVKQQKPSIKLKQKLDIMALSA